MQTCQVLYVTFDFKTVLYNLKFAAEFVEENSVIIYIYIYIHTAQH